MENLPFKTVDKFREAPIERMENLGPIRISIRENLLCLMDLDDRLHRLIQNSEKFEVGQYLEVCRRLRIELDGY